MNSSTCPSTDWLPHGTRCYRSVGHSLDFAACARYCAEQHEATLPCISSEEDAAVLGEEGGWLSQWALAARGDVGWASCDEVNSSSVAPWAFLEPDAGLLSLSCKHEDCTYVGPGGSGARDTSCDELQPCVCAWPAALVSIENNVAVQSTQAAEQDFGQAKIRGGAIPLMHEVRTSQSQLKKTPSKATSLKGKALQREKQNADDENNERLGRAGRAGSYKHLI